MYLAVAALFLLVSILFPISRFPGTDRLARAQSDRCASEQAALFTLTRYALLYITVRPVNMSHRETRWKLWNGGLSEINIFKPKLRALYCVALVHYSKSCLRPWLRTSEAMRAMSSQDDPFSGSFDLGTKVGRNLRMSTTRRRWWDSKNKQICYRMATRNFKD